MVSGAGDIENGIGDGGGSGGHGQGADAPLEGRDPLLQHILGRVGQATVDVARVGQTEAGGGMRRIAEYIR